MKLPKLAIDNFQFVLMVVLLLLFFGILSFINMPRLEDPQVNIPIFGIFAVYPGASPSDMEELIVDVIEEELKEIQEVDEISSFISEGLAVIRVETNYSVDINNKFDEIQGAINSVEPRLPEGLIRLEAEQFTPQDVNIAQYALVSDNRSYAELVEIAEVLEDELESVSELRAVEISAYPKQQIRISLDFQKIANLNIPLKQVIGILQGNNKNLPGGSIDMGEKTFSIKTSGSYETIEEIKNTVINASAGNVVYLRNIAEVDFDYEDKRYTARQNGEKAIFVTVQQKAGENLLQINDKIDKIANDFAADLPKDIAFEKPFVQAPAVKMRINEFFMNLLQGVALVGLVVLLFLGFRSSIVVMLVIPTSIIIAIGALDLSGYALQQISIASMVIALGLLVDNGIVVIENINRFLEEGFSLKEAAYKGTSEVGYAIVSSTATTILAFFPLTQLGGSTGAFLISMPLTVVFSLFASLLLALTFSPLLASQFLRIPKDSDKPSFITRVLKKIIEKYYRGILNFSLKYPILIVLFAVGTLVGSFALFPLVGISFFPNGEKDLLLIDIRTEEGSNLDRTNEAVAWVENTLTKYDYVENYTANIGKGNPQIYYNRSQRSFSPTFGQVMVNVQKYERNRFGAFLDSLRTDFATYTGAEITVSEFKQGPPSNAPIEIKISGKNLDTLQRLSKDIEKIIKSTEGVINLENPLSQSKTDIQVNINKDKAGMLGLQLSDIDLAIRASLTGITVTEVSLSNGNKYDMYLRMPFEEQPTIEDFNKIYITNALGGQVPLRQVASIEFAAGPSRINHYNTKRTTSITGEVTNSDKTFETTLDIIEKIDAIDFPKGYSYFAAGEYQNQQESVGSLGQVLVVALIGIFAVLVLQFRSFTQPFVVFTAIPLAFTGSIVALFVTGWSFSFLAFVGFTSLVGIVVNNSIILVDYTNQLRERGLSLRDAIQQSAETRFTPILLTSLTTIGGLLPLTLTNSTLWSPLGWTIIGGMVSSTILTLLIVPIMLKWFSKK